MIFNIDTEQIISDITPPTLRYQNVIELLNAWLINTKNRNSAFNQYQFETYRNYAIPPQVMSIEYLLNTIIPLTGYSIYVQDAQNIDVNYVYNVGEFADINNVRNSGQTNTDQEFLYNRSETSAPKNYFYNRSEYESYNFYISIPLTYSGSTIQDSITEVVNRVRPFGMTWTYSYY